MTLPSGKEKENQNKSSAESTISNSEEQGIYMSIGKTYNFTKMYDFSFAEEASPIVPRHKLISTNISTDEIMNVQVMHVENPDSFYVVPIMKKKELDEIERKLTELAKDETLIPEVVEKGKNREILTKKLYFISQG